MCTIYLLHILLVQLVNNICVRNFHSSGWNENYLTTKNSQITVSHPIHVILITSLDHYNYYIGKTYIYVHVYVSSEHCLSHGMYTFFIFSVFQHWQKFILLNISAIQKRYVFPAKLVLSKTTGVVMWVESGSLWPG